MKLVKVVAVEITLVKHMVLVVEKVVVKERPQILVVAHNMELVLEEAKVLQYVNQVESRLHLTTVVQLLVTPIKQVYHN